MSQPPICNYEGSDYQASFWDQGGRAYEDAVEALALQRLLPPGGKLLLELGAGAGRNTPRYHGFERIVLLDYAVSQLELARQRLGSNARYIYVAADIYHLPFIPGLFEAATMVRTLHHMADAGRALQQIRRVLQNGALFILEYANKQNLKAVLRSLLRRQNWSPCSPEPVEFAPLNFDFHPRTICRWLNEAGFSVERQLTVSHFRSEFLKRRLPLAWLVRMDAFAQLTGNWWQLAPSVFVQALAASGTNTHSQIPEDPAAFFACPVCSHHPLETKTSDSALQALHCPTCRRDWPVREGIFDFRPEA